MGDAFTSFDRLHVVLVGLPGAGKSTVGPHVAAALNRPFLDFDVELVRRGGRSIAEQFANDGEATFRSAEAALACEVASGAPAVLAPGGGCMGNAEAWNALAPVSWVVYLRVHPETAAARLAADPVERPLVRGAGTIAGDARQVLSTLLVRRGAGYESANAVVDADSGGPAAVAAAVVGAMQSTALRVTRSPGSALLVGNPG